MHSDNFFEATSRNDWASTIKRIRDECGTPKSHVLQNWTAHSRIGTDSGSGVVLIYDVEYVHCHMTETISTFRPAGGERKITGHFFKFDDPPFAHNDNGATTT